MQDHKIEHRKEDGKRVLDNFDTEQALVDLFGTKLPMTATALSRTALRALGSSERHTRELLFSLIKEAECTDAFESILVIQMTITHCAITELAGRMIETKHRPALEVYERSMTRLSRTFLAQLETLKRYRKKDEQIIRVERVTVQDGGQAIVGNVQGGPKVEK